MSRRFHPFQPLLAEQAGASDPEALVWLSASAGTGKTHVLTARVLRLLLRGVDPGAILCLTFTKAGAAEMANRIHERLAHWVRLADATLRKELFALGEAHDEAAVAIARTLFARVLDAPGAGLRIQTIHAFCQTLLAAFPIEAGLAPGFRPLEPRAQSELARTVLAELLVEAEAGGDTLVADVRGLSLRLGEGGAEGFLRGCARHADALELVGADPAETLRRLLDVPADPFAVVMEEACADGRFPCGELRRVAEAASRWGTTTGAGHAEVIGRFLAASPAERATMIAELRLIAHTAQGEPRKVSPKLVAIDSDYETLVAAIGDACRALAELTAKARLADELGAALRAGRAYARAYAAAKRARGAVDFDDLIRSAARLLATPGMGDWVRYKLDQETDHILVDEAQDTNVAQWSIVAALAGEYFAGAGAKGETRSRTIFTVGDFKQAIFGFQGTSPDAFRAAERVFANHAQGVERSFAALALDRSFRSTPPVLDVVDRLLAVLGPDALGLDAPPPRHRAARGKAGLPGSVTIWAPHVARDSGDDESGEEGWLDDATRGYATRLAREIRRWLNEGVMLATAGRPIRPEDIMVLLRKRGELAPLIVARLHAEGVPVAGVDRLRLTAPLAVRDLVAAMRFALQPDDDLNLAALLVSPLVGLSQDALYAAGHRRRATLFEAVRRHADCAEAASLLGALLARADFATPYQFLEEILSGPLDGRRKLLGRLGEEARDPIDELLAATLGFESEATPSLQRFVDWFDRGEVEVTRDPAAPLDAVRVMTVHGAKGLQAPVVILADATGDPDQAPRSSLTLPLGEVDVPIFRPRREEALGPVGAAVERAAAEERREHWRLLYVAATRAEEQLFVGGPLGVRSKGVAPARSWHAALDQAVAGLGGDEIEHPIFGHARVFSATGTAVSRARARAVTLPPTSVIPEWLRTPAPVESRPPRPLAPSAIVGDEVADPPAAAAAARAAARRGELLHALFERLPRLDPAMRLAAADRWLVGAGGVEDAGERSRLAHDACAVLSDPRFGPIFTPDALAEAPIAAVVGGQVIAGTADRLLVERDRVLIVDFKTGRRVPADLSAVPAAHLAQVGAYAAALAVIFPGRRIEAALLYTSGPTLIRLPAEVLAVHKPTSTRSEQSLDAGR